MGYYSSIEPDNFFVDEETTFPPHREVLQEHLEMLEQELAELEAERPHDPLHPDFDRYFYQDHTVHYYENPSTVQGLMFCIHELKQLLLESALSIQIAVREHPGQRPVTKKDLFKMYNAA